MLILLSNKVSSRSLMNLVRQRLAIVIAETQSLSHKSQTRQSLANNCGMKKLSL
jgi:hypothetical protein